MNCRRCNRARIGLSSGTMTSFERGGIYSNRKKGGRKSGYLELCSVDCPPRMTSGYLTVTDGPTEQVVLRQLQEVT